MSESSALIVGSGFERLGLEVVARSPTKTPYGEPSSPVFTVRIGAMRVACIARHGEGHAFAPHEINYRANLWALQQRGIRACIGVNTVGAIAPDLLPGDLAVPDQLIDYTSGRVASFGGAGAPVVHAEFAEPFSPLLRGRITAALADCGYPPHAGTYGVTQGPRLETAAEINRMQRDGCAMVGMTAMPEAVLARELGIDYAVCAVVLNYAAGRGVDAGSIDGQIHRFMEAGLERLATVLGRVFDGSSPWAL
ncbi:MAG: S-methyl-5'-thioinosine phosphorylase [Gammaproteobacteria bacterium]